MVALVIAPSQANVARHFAQSRSTRKRVECRECITYLQLSLGRKVLLLAVVTSLIQYRLTVGYSTWDHLPRYSSQLQSYLCGVRTRVGGVVTGCKACVAEPVAWRSARPASGVFQPVVTHDRSQA